MKNQRWLVLLIAGFVALVTAHAVATYALDFEWWKEMGQLDTWFNQILYGVAPVAIATILIFVILWVVHARGMKAAGVGLSRYPSYAKLTTFLALGLAYLIAGATIETWTVVRFFGGRSLAADPAAWHDPLFGLPLAFYFFELPFYHVILRVLLTVSVISALVYAITAKAWDLRHDFAEGRVDLQAQAEALKQMLDSVIVRGLLVLALVGLAASFYLDRYDLLLTDHGFMLGADYVNENLSLPLQWVAIAGALVAGVFIWLRRPGIAAGLLVILFAKAIVPWLVTAVYVRPNEISIERPYIERHIAATRSAYGLNTRAREIQFPANLEGKIDFQKNRETLDNVRLWDWNAFRSTLTQIQPLRPYVFSDTDPDRYTIDGHLRQVLIAPREIELNQLGDARNSWINPRFIYTHGYGVTVAEANRITPTGLPLLLVKDAPLEIATPSLKVERPELYFGEEVHEPVFVRTAQPEFNYPSGSDNVQTRYAGQGGFAMSSVLTRFAAAFAYGDWNILLTSLLTPESRMMIHRQVRERLHTLAGFINWEKDPYIVITEQGRLVWIVDGYLTSDRHPYSRGMTMEDFGEVNYIRNSVKATIDAYDGTTNIYVFDSTDPLLRAYRNLFPKLFRPESEMPKDLRAHARYPETLFTVQAEIYRTFHMRDPQSFYNKADLWDVANFTGGANGTPIPTPPTYVVATLPGETKPEFLLLLAYTPRKKDNLIGFIAARCDGERLGELIVLLLPKQELLLGPMQIDARINQDQNISKDLTLWGQQGSTVLRGQILVLPIDNTFLYVEPIYIEAAQAKMPQLKKVALAMGNTLVYADTYEQGIAQLTAAQGGSADLPVITKTALPGITVTNASPQENEKLTKKFDEIRVHFKRYRELTAQGKLAEAGKELEAVEAAIQH